MKGKLGTRDDTLVIFDRFRKVIVEDHATDGGFDVLAIERDRIGMQHILAVIRLGEIDHLSGVAQTDRREGFHFAHFEREQNFLNRRESAIFALRSVLGLGQVIDAEHHILSRNGQGLTRCRRQNVVRA